MLDDAAKELAALAIDVDVEERISREEHLFEGEGDEDGDEDDNLDGWTNVRAELSDEEREELDKTLQPVRLVLVKASLSDYINFQAYQFLSQLCKITFAIRNSSTLILPRWYALLNELKLDERIIPWDVSTRWNSTYNMLKFALDYRIALDTITEERDMKLRKYELKDVEWDIARQLGDILEVHSYS